jgi:hypothetical protein
VGQVIIQAKTSKGGQQGCVFVLWGSIAKKLKSIIHATPACPIRFVETANPAVEQFHFLDSYVLVIAAPMCS